MLVLFLGAKLIQRLTPANVLIECRELADVAETRRREDTRWRVTVAVPVAIVTVWFLAAIIVSALMAAYIHH